MRESPLQSCPDCRSGEKKGKKSFMALLFRRDISDTLSPKAVQMWEWKHRRVMAKLAPSGELRKDFVTLLMERLPKGIFHLILFCKVFFASFFSHPFHLQLKPFSLSSRSLLSAGKASQLYTWRRRLGSARWQFLLLCDANKRILPSTVRRTLEKIYQGKLKSFCCRLWTWILQSVLPMSFDYAMHRGCSTALSSFCASTLMQFQLISNHCQRRRLRRRKSLRDFDRFERNTTAKARAT